MEIPRFRGLCEPRKTLGNWVSPDDRISETIGDYRRPSEIIGDYRNSDDTNSRDSDRIRGLGKSRKIETSEYIGIPIGLSITGLGDLLYDGEA